MLSNKHLCYIFNLSKIKLINYTRAYKRMHASRFRNYSVQEVKRFFMTGRYGLSVRRGHTVILDLLLGVPLLSAVSEHYTCLFYKNFFSHTFRFHRTTRPENNISRKKLKIKISLKQKRKANKIY